jgi:hypothetical protein
MVDLSKAFLSKTDQLNSSDLTRNAIFTIKNIVFDNEKKEQKVSVYLSPAPVNADGVEVPWKPCKTMGRVLIASWGDDASLYIGRKIELYTDKDVSFGVEKVGGIRIAALSNLPNNDQSFTAMLPSARGKKKAYTVRLIKTELLAYPQDSFNKNKDGFIKAILDKKATIDDIIGKARSKGFELSKDQLDELNSSLLKKELKPLTDDLFNLKSDFYFSNGTYDVDKFKKDLSEDGFYLTKEQESSLMPIGENDE